MRFTALIAATMALAGSTAAQSQCHAGGTANCKPGYDYCAKTLSNRGKAMRRDYPCFLSAISTNYLAQSPQAMPTPPSEMRYALRDIVMGKSIVWARGTTLSIIATMTTR